MGKCPRPSRCLLHHWCSSGLLAMSGLPFGLILHLARELLTKRGEVEVTWPYGSHGPQGPWTMGLGAPGAPGGACCQTHFPGQVGGIGMITMPNWIMNNSHFESLFSVPLCKPLLDLQACVVLMDDLHRKIISVQLHEAHDIIRTGGKPDSPSPLVSSFRHPKSSQ